MRNTIVLLIVSLGMAGCGEAPLSSYAHRERPTAPQNEKQVGLLISHTDSSELAQLLKSEPQAEFRILNEQHGLYEVYGLTEKQIQGHLPNVQVAKNDFIPLQQSKLMPFAMESLPGLKECVKNEQAPLAVITSPDKIQDGDVVNRGLTLRLSSAESKVHPSHKGKLIKAWGVAAPKGSAITDDIKVSDNFEFKPDSLGLYQILLVVQDERNVCAAEMFNLVVTANVTFKIPAEDDRLKSLDLKTFSHRTRIHADEAAALSQGEGVVIAVIDSGVNYNHPLLAANIYINKKEVEGNGIDDDNNGFVDDVYGFDFANKDAFPYDDVGHGSHVAGLAAGLQFGMATKAKILPVKALGPQGGDVGSITASILYAVDQGAQVLNMSFGNYGKPHPKLLEALNYAEEKNVIVVAAAGNGHPMTGAPINTDELPNFPSAASNKNIISVAASAKDQVLASYSNFGVKTVDVVLPGGDEGDLLVSCTLENAKDELFEGMSGTSMATPIASGLIAQMLSLNPKLSATEVRRVLMTTGQVKKELKPLIGAGRHVDAEQAVLKVKGGSTQLLM